MPPARIAVRRSILDPHLTSPVPGEELIGGRVVLGVLSGDGRGVCSSPRMGEAGWGFCRMALTTPCPPPFPAAARAGWERRGDSLGMLGAGSRTPP